MNPRDNKGRFVPRACPICDNGHLQPDGDGYWRCDGLLDPEDENKELEPCLYTHHDGDNREG